MDLSSTVYIVVGNQKFTIDQFLSFRQKIGSLRGSEAINKSLRKELNSSYKFFSDATDALIANAIGASQIRALSGKGFQPDNILIKGDILEFSETKSITTKITDNALLKANKISLGSISLSNLQNIATAGVVSTEQGYEQSTEKFALSSEEEKASFIKNLKDRTSQNRKIYLQELSMQDSLFGKAAKQIITNIGLKSSKIYVSTPKISGGSNIREIGWTWEDILKNPAARLVISSKGELDVIFSEKLVTDALNNSLKTIEYKNLEEVFVKNINEILAKSLFSQKTFEALASFDITLEKLIKWEQGSVRVYNATLREIIDNKKIYQKKKTSQKFISDTQITVLIQKEVEKRMPKGPMRGPPLSPTILTYRSGAFVDSIKVIQDLRQKLITYFYAPNYKIHERKGARAPRLLIQPSIRAVVQREYAEKFRIIRGF